MGKLLSALSLSKPGKNAEVILKTYEPFAYGDAHYINNYKNV
jgi:hypothetical protein